MKPDTKTLTLSEFCEAYRIPKSTLYGHWKAGLGPDFYVVGRRKFITVAAAERWRRGFEAPLRKCRRTDDAQALPQTKTRAGSAKRTGGATTETRGTNSGRRDPSATRVGVRAKSRPVPTATTRPKKH